MSHPQKAGLQQHLLLALTNPVEGRDDEFNEWYTHRHLKDLLDIPGVVAARRYSLSDRQRMPPPYPYGYCALYEIETDDLSTVMAELARRARTPAMPISEAMAPNALILYLTPITDRVTRPAEGGSVEAPPGGTAQNDGARHEALNAADRSGQPRLA